MPGWGSWTGEGVSKRAQKRNKGKVMTKKEGIKKKDRKDAKLQKVILNEKRVRKVCLNVILLDAVWWLCHTPFLGHWY
jgi:U3 small nucleolar RNA-associated protein 14